MPKHRIVVDGSNLATEGRTTPSLDQLDEAVRAYVDEHPNAEVIVVADATFEHRVAPTDRARFKEAELAGEIVTPPAGAIGRGDAFILKIAARIGAVVLSNDSFQEFHEEHAWLFEPGRLVGGKPVPGVGWVFTDRLPVRGAKSPRAVKKLTVALPDGSTPVIGATITPAKTSRVTKSPLKSSPKADKSEKLDKPMEKLPEKDASKASVKPATTKRAPRKAATQKATSPKVTGTKAPAGKVAKAVKSDVVPAANPPRAAKAVKAVKADKAAKKPASRRATKVSESPAIPTPEPAVALRRGRHPVNPESSFDAFVGAHKLRAQVSGEVVAFTSHGAIIAVDAPDGSRVECYAPTTSLGSPAPARARDVLKRGDHRTFRLVSVDRDRRIAELALS